MKSAVKEQFVERLEKIRNYVVADIQITNGKEIKFEEKPEPKEEEEKKSEEAPEEVPERPNSLLGTVVNFFKLYGAQKSGLALAAVVMAALVWFLLWCRRHGLHTKLISFIWRVLTQNAFFKKVMSLLFNYKV